MSRVTFTIRDIKGKTIVLLICAMIWYSEVLQFGFLYISNALLLLGALLVVVVLSDITSDKWKKLKDCSKELIILGLYLILTFVFGVVTAPNISAHISHGITCIEFYLVMIAVYYYSVTRNKAMFLAWNYLILYAISVVAFLSNPQVVYEGSQIRYSLSTSLNVNAFSMGITMAIWSVLYLVSSKKINLLFGVGIVGIFLYSIFLTGSRKGLLGAVLCIVLWATLCYLPLSQKKGLGKKIARYISIAVVGFAIIAILAPIYNDSYMAVRISSLFSQSDASTIARLDMYGSGIKYLWQSPFLGHGFWGFSHFYGFYSHANLIEVPVSSGVLLAGIYFYTYFVTLKKLIRNRRYLNRKKGNIIYYLQVQVGFSTILFVMMLFYSISVIHIYELSSYISFAFIYATNDNVNK